ncbi:hypothetical protein RhiTH_001886 [Rhizoctonia solani]
MLQEEFITISQRAICSEKRQVQMIVLKPPPPGQRRKKEDWEFLWYAGMFGGMIFGGVLLYYKPDTSIQTWALREAKERMEARGEKIEYKPS